ncbi:MAG: sulfite exporter TauE/SafE family protein [Promethearchaeota archaeon]
MEFILTLLVIIFAFGCAFIDCAFGMGYGTLMSPILLILGFTISAIVPVLLLSQMIIGGVACISHHRLKNADFKSSRSKDTKSALIFTFFGSIAMIFAILIVISIPNVFLMMYIGILITLIGFLLLFNKDFVFSKGKLYVIGGISAFNKAISGGGFGPIVTSGQVMNGSDVKNAVAVTALAETLLSALGFVLYVFLTGFLNFELTIIVLLSGVIAAPIGAYQAKKLKEKNAKSIIAFVIICLGILTLLKSVF